jgi:predicted DNA-binding protein
MAQYIPGNRNFMKDSSVLNQQLMQMNRDRINQATKMFQIARQTQDPKGMAEARNMLEGKGFFSRNFGDTEVGRALFGKYNRPYNRDLMDEKKKRDSLKVDPALLKKRDELKQKVTQKTGSAMADVLGAGLGSAPIGKERQWEEAGLAPNMEEGRLAPGMQQAGLAPNMVEGKTLPQRDENFSGLIPNNNPATINMLKSSSIKPIATPDTMQDVGDAGKIAPVMLKEDIDRDVNELEKTEQAIQTQERMKEIASAPTQVRGQMRQDWNTLKKRPLNQLSGDYSEERDTILNTGLDAISAMGSEKDRYKNIIQLNNKLMQLDRYFNIKPRDRSKELFAMFKAPKRAGRGGSKKKIRKHFIDMGDTRKTFDIDTSQDIDSKQNKARIKRFLEREGLYSKENLNKILNDAKLLGTEKGTISPTAVRAKSEDVRASFNEELKRAKGLFYDNDKKEAINRLNKKWGTNVRFESKSVVDDIVDNVPDDAFFDKRARKLLARGDYRKPSKNKKRKSIGDLIQTADNRKP